MNALATEETGDTEGVEPADRTAHAAIFLMMLSDDAAAQLLARLEPDELEALGGAMLGLGEVDHAGMASALDDFVVESTRAVLPRRDRSAQMRGLLERSLGTTKAESMMLRIAPGSRPLSIEMARWLAPQVLLKLIEDEHPQVIAALLLMLEPEPAAEVLSQLPAAAQPLVVEKIAAIGPVSAQAVALIDRLLSQRIGSSFGANALSVGGPREAANLINLGAGVLRTEALPSVARRNAPLAERIEEELFTFEMLLECDASTIERVLRDVDGNALIDALKGLQEEQREIFYAAMSSRAADGVREEIELRGRIARTDVERAQRSLVTIARQLADSGEIIIGNGDGEFV
ncbi:flagellar motor switch protein FliG [Erythrobacter sp.]|uniref:flagellar motor switch protein FliG n=1 Tax=Erythrobacter sp. TaxID=1042 RepID=UPI002E9DFFA5|nr:FliG C-terminal domain-containing protein [Erythrobacter sp.]